MAVLLEEVRQSTVRHLHPLHVDLHLEQQLVQDRVPRRFVPNVAHDAVPYVGLGQL